MQEKLKKQFLIGVTDTPDAMDKVIKSETENLTKVFKEAGI
jgi:tripartite-type tricarboxylate transporter receptor subunit TctC